MLFTIAATTYCTLMYVAGVKCFGLKIGSTSFAGLILWLLSPITVPFMFLVLLMAG